MVCPGDLGRFFELLIDSLSEWAVRVCFLVMAGSLPDLLGKDGAGASADFFLEGVREGGAWRRRFISDFDDFPCSEGLSDLWDWEDDESQSSESM